MKKNVWTNGTTLYYGKKPAEGLELRDALLGIIVLDGAGMQNLIERVKNSSDHPILALEVVEYGFNPELSKIITKILSSEKYLKFFLNNKNKEQDVKNLLHALDITDEYYVRQILNYEGFSVFGSHYFAKRHNIYETLNRYASEYFQLKYALELLDKSKIIFKVLLPDLFQDIEIKFQLDYFAEGTHHRGSAYDTIGLNFQKKYEGVSNFPLEDKEENLNVILHEYLHGVFDRLIDPQVVLSDQINDSERLDSIFHALSEGFCVLVENFLGIEAGKNAKNVNLSEEQGKKLRKLCEERWEKFSREKSHYYEGTFLIMKKIYDQGGFSEVVKFINSIDPEKALNINRNHPVYQQVIQQGSPLKLLEIIGKDIA